jgi:hypothetical protein
MGTDQRVAVRLLLPSAPDKIVHLLRSIVALCLIAGGRLQQNPLKRIKAFGCLERHFGE